MFTALYSLRWRVLRVRLRNIRNTYAREHPLAIFEAVLRSAAGHECLPSGEPWLFHPLEPWGERIRMGRDYAMEVVFPVSSAEAVEAFRKRLATYLLDKRHNFDLVSMEGPCLRSLAQLETETEELDAAAERELCLDFLTPLAFRPPEPSRRWLITGNALFEGLVQRVESLWKLDLAWSPESLRGVETLPCFWRYVEYRHASKSSGGSQLLNGCMGPLYLKGDLRPWLPLLRLGTEAHVGASDGQGQRLAFGAGAYQLRGRRQFFTGATFNMQTWREALAELAAENPEPDPFLHSLDPAAELTQLVADIRSSGWQTGEAAGFWIDKKPCSPGLAGGGAPVSPAGVDGKPVPECASPPPGEEPATTLPHGNGKSDGRLISQFTARDRLVHRVLQRMLTPVWDRLFETASHGFRAGRSVSTARQAVLDHVRKGCAWVLEADVASFFDEVDWTLLEARLDRSLPEGDTVLRELLRRIVKTALTIDGRLFPRTRGLIQGCALSPLLANLYLDPFDEAAAAAGLRLVRYADDFLVMCRDETEAAQAYDTVVRLLAAYGLRLKPDKVAVTPVAAGFQFLGQSFAPELDEDFLERTTLRKPLHVLPDYSFAGLDAEALILRRGKEPAGQVPLRRLSEITFLGAHSVSTPLLQRCAELRVPVSFCSAAGHHFGTLRPDSRQHFEIAGRHYVRHGALTPSAVAAQAGEIVAAKLGNYLAWVRETPSETRLAEHIERLLASLPRAEDVAVVRGIEGDAARRMFRWANDHVRIPGFASRQREARRKADPWNSLLDFAYTRLFARLNVLVRNRGLNPYLGWLHSAGDLYESLVCDLQEPFRARCDRWALRIVNRRQVRLEDFAPHPYGGLRLTAEATRGLLELWEREMDTRVATDPGTFEQLLHAQADAVLAWVNGAPHLRLYRAAGQRLPSLAPLAS